MNDIRKDTIMLPQTQSPLFSLPGELRNCIYNLALTPSTTIINPSWKTPTNSEDRNTLNLGVALLRTCRTVYLEADSSIILRNSNFIFTRVAHIQAFFSRLSVAQTSLVHNITIDLREAASGDPAFQSEKSTTIANEWTHYLCCVQGAHYMGAWCSNLSTLRSDIPDLRSLCIDMTGWQPDYAGTRLKGWKYLHSLLRKLRGLDSFTLKGRCLDSSSWSLQPVPWSLGLWFSPVFDKDESVLVDLVGEAVREEQEGEVRSLEWRTVDGVTFLTVRVDDVRKSPFSTSSISSLSENGRIQWSEFLEFKEGQVELAGSRKGSLSVGGIEPHRTPAILV